MKDVFESSAIYRIEYELILNIKDFRLKRGWSQRTLSGKMGFAETFVGKCEAIDQPEKYNLRHLRILKTVFGFSCLDDLFPNGLPDDELIKVKYKKIPKVKKDGTISKLSDTVVVDIVVVEGGTKIKSNKA
ncbi:XRE family transcriptional regulator [Galbibacter sp.]|uniref:XRE family transcriptional regulator n=1 Tax=Galbibacter sp. TaxID=2918471 RepID=UPI003A9406F1